MPYSTVFGPVRSGRLGLSLGLDCLGARVCSMDCVYCEVGKTDTLTTERRPWAPAATILAELADWKAKNPDVKPDHVTLGGLGEPCLNSELAAIIAGARAVLPGVPVAVLTNATPLADPAVRRELAGADMVLPSLDSLVPEEFARINRPAPGVTCEAVAQAILDFRREFSGKLYLEVLLIAGVNDSAENLRRLTEYAGRLRPDRVDVVTLSRPGTSPHARPVSLETLAAWRAALCPPGSPQESGEKAPVACETEKMVREQALLRAEIINSLKRRPQRGMDIASALGASVESIDRTLAEMVREGELFPRTVNNEIYYAPPERD